MFDDKKYFSANFRNPLKGFLSYVHHWPMSVPENRPVLCIVISIREWQKDVSALIKRKKTKI